MYTKAFEIRWNDLDANMHLGNSTYIEYMSDTRMSFLTSRGLSLEVINSYSLGPIVMYEQINYFKEKPKHSFSRQFIKFYLCFVYLRVRFALKHIH